MASGQRSEIGNRRPRSTSSAIEGGLLALVVIFLFLRTVSTTIIIGLAIPISLIATFIPMHMWGITLNVMSLSPPELEQFLYDVSVKAESDKIIITTAEVDISAFLKVLFTQGG